MTFLRTKCGFWPALPVYRLLILSLFVLLPEVAAFAFLQCVSKTNSV